MKTEISLAKVIKNAMLIYGISQEEMSSCIRCSKRTWVARMKQPETFRLFEIKQIAKKLHIPIQTILSYQYGDKK